MSLTNAMRGLTASNLAASAHNPRNEYERGLAIQELERRAHRWDLIDAAARTKHSAADLCEQVYHHTIELGD